MTLSTRKVAVRFADKGLSLTPASDATFHRIAMLPTGLMLVTLTTWLRVNLSGAFEPTGSWIVMHWCAGNGAD
jgi:hypothetical protein